MRNTKLVRNLKKTDLKGRKVLLRVDFNVPIKNGVVQDDIRIIKALPTIKFLQKNGAKVILLTHLGKGGESLLPVVESASKFLKFTFVPEIIGENVQEIVSNMKNGEIVLLENIRNNKGEQNANKDFAKSLAKLGDIYVNDAFPVSHRADASVVLLPKILPAYMGFRMEEEVKKLTLTLKNKKHPFLFILGGAKFSTKIPLLIKYLKIADYVFLGGALLNDVLKAKGFEVGQSLVDKIDYDLTKIIKNKKLILPEYILVQSGTKILEKRINELDKNDFILDIGESGIGELSNLIKKSKLILWNGPLGKYEDGGDVFTRKILKIISQTKTESIIGGGDTANLVDEMKLEKKFGFVSTGGGATLEFLAKGTLPGIKALQ
jgi:3-phosphoglycerate kinase